MDFDNDGDLDIFLSYAFGHPVMLKNLLSEEGESRFVDISKEIGLKSFYTNSVCTVDFNRDGLLDVMIGASSRQNFSDYPKDKPEKTKPLTFLSLNMSGDKRMFNFMHDS